MKKYNAYIGLVGYKHMKMMQRKERCFVRKVYLSSHRTFGVEYTLANVLFTTAGTECKVTIFGGAMAPPLLLLIN